MGTTLTGTTPQDTYDSLIKVTDNGPLSGTAKYLSDGLGNDSVLALSTSAIAIGTNTALAARLVTARGRVAISNASGANDSQLALYADGTTNGIYSTYNSTGSYLPMAFYTSDVERMRITSAGSVLVGTSSSDLTRNMIVAGTAGMAVQYAGNAGTYFDIAPAAANGAVTLAADARTGAYPDMIFRTSAAEQVRITSGGVLQLTQGQIKFPATQVASADPNTLDDYEEGTWTPVITSGYTSPTYSGTTGYYTKIGRVVNFTLRLQLTGGTAQVAQISIGGLPFTTNATDGSQGAAVVGYWNGAGVSGNEYLFVSASSTQIECYLPQGVAFSGTTMNDNTWILHAFGSYNI